MNTRGHDAVELQGAGGRAVVRQPTPSVVHVETHGLMTGTLVDETLGTVDRLLASLPADATRTVFMDHSHVTAIEHAIVMISLRWYLRGRRQRFVHLRLADLPLALRLWLRLLYPILRSGCEFHARGESFEAALAACADSSE